MRNRAQITQWTVLCLALCGSLFWAYWTTLQDVVQRWANDPQYSHGYLVPGFAAILLWRRRALLTTEECQTSRWGWLILGGGVLLRLTGVHYYFLWFDPISLLPCLVGICLLLGGWQALRWSWPAIAFLIFMIPLPYRVEIALAAPLQRMATLASTFVLQTVGLPAIAEGNVILLNEVEIGIVEACSGLRMLVIFFALSTAVALMMEGRWTDRVLIVASAIPIALVTNIIRIAATGILHDTVGSQIANAVFHDLAGWLMMPIALLFLGLELQLIKWVLEEPSAQPLAA